MEKQIQTKIMDWYENLVNDLKEIIIGTNKNIAMAKWSIGDRILRDHLKFKKAKYGEKSIENLGKDVGVSARDLWRCLKFRKKFPIQPIVTHVSQLTWSKIIKQHLIESSKDEDLFDLEPKDLPEYPNWLRFTTVWTFQDTGIIGDGLSNLPCQILQNLFYHYLKGNETILDPFAGSGLTKEVINWYNKEYNGSLKSLNYDINPTRDFINKNDIRNGFLKEVNNIDLIFLDPPYWKMVDYGENSLNNLSLKDFFISMSTLSLNCHKVLKKGGKIAFVIMPVKDNGRYIDLGFECFNIFKKQFTPIQRFCVPVIKQPHPINKGEFMATLRDLFVMEKK